MAGNLQNIIGQIQQAFSNAEKTVRNTDTNRNASSVREPNTAVSNDVRRTRTGANRMQTSRQDAVRISNNIRTTTRSARAKAQNVVQANSSVANYMPSSQFNWNNATLSSTLSRMHELSGNDTAKWQQYVGMFQNEVNNPNSPIYSPYLFNRTYTYGKYAASNEAATLKFEQQWADAKAKAAYWAGRTDLNLSDDDIIARVNLDGYSEIKALNKKIAEGGTGYYTRQLGYSPEVLYGVIWAARNGGGTGDDLTNLLAYGDGVGNLYQRNDNIQSRLDPTNERYNPYSVGSTYDDATSYFGVSQFDKDWLTQNRYLLNGSDKDVKMYQSVYAAEQTTLKAEAEYAELQSRMQEVFASNMDDPDEIMDMLFDKDPYNARGYTDALTKLGDMDESLKSGKIISMTRPVDYSYNDIRQQVVQHCEDIKAQKTAAAVANNVSAATGANNVSSQANTLIDEARDNAMKSAGRTIRAQGTGEEKLVFKTSNAGFENYMQQINDAVAAGTLDKAGAYVALLNGANEYAAANYLAMREAEDSRAALKELQGEMVDGSFLDTMFAEEDELIANIRASYELASRLSNTGSADASLLNLMDYLYDNGKEYVPTQWSATTAFDFLRESGYGESDINYAARETIIHKEKEVAKIDSVLSQVKEAGIKGADKYIKNLERKKEACQRDIQDAQYYLLPQEKSDFSTVVSDYKQKAEEAWAGKEWTYNKFLHNSNDGVPFEAYALYHPERSIEAGIPYNLLTENERNTYLYLAATDGKDSANEYYNYLQEETLAVRKAFALQETASEAASDGLAGAAFSTLMSITSSPLQVAGSIYSVVQGLRGEEINPYHSTFAANMFISSTRGTVKSEIDEAFGADSIGAKIANIGYDALTSSGDSLISGAMGMGSTVASVLSMGTEAASGAVMDAKLRGATDSQALLYGGMTLAAESGTEFLPMDNIIDAFKGANTTAAKQFVADVLKDVAAEGVGEGLNELIEGVGDDLIMGELSERNQAIAQYMAEGMTEEEATRKATDDFVAQIGYAAITGAVSGAVSMTTSRIAGTVSGESGTERVSYEDATNYYNAIADAEISTAAQQNTVNFDMAAYQELAALTQSLQSSNAGKATAISGVMQFSGMDMETARAAGQALVDKVGGSKAVLAMQQIIYSAAEHGTNLAESVRAIANSALAGSESTTAQIRQFAEGNVTSEALNSFIAESGQIAETMSADITQRVTENAIANAMREVISDGALDGVKTYEVALQQAKENVRAAAENLARAVAEKDAAWQNMQDINAKFLQNPADAQLHGMMQQAINDMTGKVKVIEEYKQSVAKFETQQKVAETTLKNMREAAMKHARQEAVQRVMDQRAARAAEIAQQAAESLQNTDAGNTSEVVPTQTFEQQLNTWDGKERGRVFTLGETSDVLHAIGVPDAKIVMYGDKIINIKKKHPGMTDTVIKQIPQIIDDPVIVMKSRTVSNRITMFGEVMDANDVPVLAILDLNTAKDEVVNADFMTLVSAYGKNNKAQSFINSSEILYINKNKADAWQVSTGLQLPFESATIGKDSVAQNAVSVNPSVSNSTQNYSYGAQEGTQESFSSTRVAPGSANGPIKSGNQIMQEIAQGLGLPADTRKSDYERSLRKRTKGYTRKGYGSIHVLDAQNIQTAAHEWGHVFDQAFDLQKNAHVQEMVKTLSADPARGAWLNSYDDAQKPGEVIAEYVKYWMMDRDNAIAFAGKDFTNYFEKSLKEKGWLKTMQQGALDMRNNLTATAADRAMSEITLDERKSTNKYEKGLKGLAFKYLDFTLPWQEVTETMKAAGKFKADTDVRTLLLAKESMVKNLVDSCLYDHLVDPQGNIVDEKSFKDILNKVPQKDEKAFNTMWALLHAQARQDMTIAKAVFGEDVNIDAAITQLEAKHPEFREIIDQAEEWYTKFMQTWEVDTGLLDQDAFDFMRATYPYYVPLFRTGTGNAAENRPTAGRNNTPGSGIKRAKGSTADKYNPAMGIVEYMQHYIANYKNIETLRAFDTTMKAYPGLNTIAEPVQGDMTRESYTSANARAKQAVQEALEALRQGGENVTPQVEDTLLSAMDALPSQGWVAKDTATGEDVLNIPLEDGTISRWVVHNQPMLQALLAQPQSRRSSLLRAIGNLTRFLSAQATSHSATFTVQNLISDSQTAMVTGHTAHDPIRYTANAVASAFDLLKNNILDARGKDVSETYRLFKIFGKMDSRYALRDKRTQTEIRKNLYGKSKTAADVAKKIVSAPVIGLEALSEFSENISRYNAFRKDGIEKTTYAGALESGRHAREDTTDFSKHGLNTEDLKFAKTVVPFFNASLQGVYKTATLFKSENAGNRMKVAGGLVAGVLLPRMIYEAIKGMTWDDEEKEAEKYLNQYEKDSYIHLKLPSGRMIKFKKSQDAIVKTMDAVGKFLYDVLTGYETNDEDPVVSAMAELKASAFEIARNSIVQFDTVFNPFIDAANNKTWSGAEIENYQMLQLPTTQRYDEDTLKFFRALSNASVALGVDFSPKDWEYIFGQYTGSMGAIGVSALELAEKGEFNMGNLFGLITDKISSRMSVDPVYSNNISSTFYGYKTLLAENLAAIDAKRNPVDLRRDLTQEEINAAYAEGTLLLKKEGAIGAAAKKAKDLWKEIDEIMDSETMTDAEKESKAREVRKQINQTLLEANAAYGDYMNKYGYDNGAKKALDNMLELFSPKKPQAEDQVAWYAISDTFKADENKSYMQKSHAVWEATGKDSAIPHPKESFSQGGVEYTISEADWPEWEATYRDTYQGYIDRNSMNWDTMKDEERLELLKKAHSKAHDAAKKQYMQKHGGK